MCRVIKIYNSYKKLHQISKGFETPLINHIKNYRNLQFI
jgi:hypothetical protein